MDWSKIPDLIAVVLLTWAFASVVRQHQTRASRHWLYGWILILLHFLAFLFIPNPGFPGKAAEVLGALFLVWAGLLFTRASVPFRTEPSSRVMMGTLVFTYTLFICELLLNSPTWALLGSAALLGLAPLTVALSVMRRFQHRLRWMLVGFQVVLATFLILVRKNPGYSELALNAVLFTVYLACSFHFLYQYRRRTAGSLITITAFFFWAAVFVLAPVLISTFPLVHLENEAWNLPKYVVAVGMILLLLEDEVVHNKHLALHDELTGLPNRRLFQDRLANALERARRNHAQTALLMVDLNEFKQVNDTFGHHIGDLLLQEVASLFKNRVRRSDTVARTGGDEFAVILDSPTTPEEAEHVARSLMELLEAPIVLGERRLRVSASLGMAVFPDDAVDMEALCIAADLRMYQEKHRDSGHNSFSNFGPNLRDDRGFEMRQ